MVFLGQRMVVDDGSLFGRVDVRDGLPKDIDIGCIIYKILYAFFLFLAPG
jgi:hypothetical protein